MSLAVPILHFPDWVFNLPQSDVQTERTPKSDPVSPQSRGHLFIQNVRVKVTQNLMGRENRVAIIKYSFINKYL